MLIKFFKSNIVPMLYHNLISLECHPQTVLTKEGRAYRKIEAQAPRSIVDIQFLGNAGSHHAGGAEKHLFVYEVY